MGLLASDPYLTAIVTRMSPLVISALENAANRLGNATGDAAAQRWFGDNSMAFKSTLARDLRRMKSVINIRTITIGSEDASARNPNTNASAWTANARVGLGDAIIKPGGGGPHGFDSRSVYLDMGFRKLPNLLPIIPAPPPMPGAGPVVGPPAGPTINANAWHQSQFNTLVHELTHLLIGTADEVGANGTAYGSQRAAALAVADSGRAKNNAENWGIFVEACGHQNIS